MESNGSERSGLLTAGGVLSIVAGIYLIVIGVTVAIRLMLASDITPVGERAWQEVMYYGPFPPFFVYWPSYRWVIIGGCVSVLGIVAIVGGISAIRKYRFGLSLAGAMCSLPSAILGILAVIFVALGKREFGPKRKEDGI